MLWLTRVLLSTYIFDSEMYTVIRHGSIRFGAYSDICRYMSYIVYFGNFPVDKKISLSSCWQWSSFRVVAICRISRRFFWLVNCVNFRRKGLKKAFGRGGLRNLPKAVLVNLTNTRYRYKFTMAEPSWRFRPTVTCASRQICSKKVYILDHLRDVEIKVWKFFQNTKSWKLTRWTISCQYSWMLYLFTFSIFAHSHILAHTRTLAFSIFAQNHNLWILQTRRPNHGQTSIIGSPLTIIIAFPACFNPGTVLFAYECIGVWNKHAGAIANTRSTCVLATRINEKNHQPHP